MQQAVRLPKEIIDSAQIHGKIFSRTAPKQISYWVKIGQLAEENPNIGIEKKGVLKNVRVYKFKMQKQLTLCAYILPNSQRIILLSLGGHENKTEKY